MQLIQVKLLGELGRTFGRSYEFMANSPKDIMSALCNQLTGFKQFMVEAHEHGIGFKVIDGDPEGMDYANFTMGCRKLIIAPVVSGSGAIGRILLGVALVALAFVSFGVSTGGVSKDAMPVKISPAPRLNIILPRVIVVPAVAAAVAVAAVAPYVPKTTAPMPVNESATKATPRRMRPIDPLPDTTGAIINFLHPIVKLA